MGARASSRATLALLAAACASLLAAAPAAADNGPHVKGAGLTPDSCAACHRAHTAQAPHLLREPETALCYTCHGATASGSKLDVQDGVAYSEYTREGTKVAGALRGGGFEYARIDSAHPSGNGYLGDIPTLSSGAAVTSAHSVDESPQTAWGNGPISETANYGATIQLRCGSCHDPHGNGMYRILRPIPRESGAEAGVEIPDTSTKVYTTENYWEVEDINDPSFVAKISEWCATCHTRFLAHGHSGREASGDAVYAYRHRTDFTSQGTPTCIQCHVAHGTNASMGGYAAGVEDPEGKVAGGDSYLLRIDNRGVCMMCHPEK